MPVLNSDILIIAEGYLKDEYPKVKVESPPAIGNSFENPKLFPVMKSTGKIMSVGT